MWYTLCMNISRRNFLTGIGGLVAVSQLPSLADNPAVFPQRARNKLLNLAYQHVSVGATAPFSILHISDTHLTDAYPDEDEKKQKLKQVRTQTFGGRQEEALRDSLAWAKDNVDYVLHTGDLIDWQSQANFDLVKKYYGGAMFGSMGNHEFYTYLPGEKITSEESFKARSWPLLKAAYPVDPRFSAQTVNGVNFVCLDGTFGTVQPDLVEKFKAEVRKGLPIVLCMHVPFITDEIWRADRKYWSGVNRKYRNAAIPDPASDYKRQREDPTTRDFIAYLKEEKLLRAILAGHLHITVQERFSPTAVQYVVGGNYGFVGQEVLFT